MPVSRDAKGGALAPFYGLLTRPVQRARLRAVEPWLRGARSVLDLGCGLTELPSRFASYVGCDRDPLVLAECRRRHPAARFVTWDLGAAEAPVELSALPNGGFDLVLMAAVLEHLASPGVVLARAARFLGTDGKLVATTPHPLGRLPLEAGERLGLLSHAAGEEHESLLSRATLEELARGAGLQVVAYRRFLLGLNQTIVFAKAAAS